MSAVIADDNRADNDSDDHSNDNADSDADNNKANEEDYDGGHFKPWQQTCKTALLDF